LDVITKVLQQLPGKTDGNHSTTMPGSVTSAEKLQNNTWLHSSDPDLSYMSMEDLSTFLKLHESG
jgi:hypothetical protein